MSPQSHPRKVIKKAFLSAFPHTLPVLAGFFMLGSAYGILMETNGYGVGWSLMTSLLAFCGSMQFLGISLLVTAFDPLQAFIMSIMVNARHLFYGISMLEKYKGLGKARFPLIYMLCDETFSISSSIEPPKDVDRKYFYLTISVLDYLYWAMGTVIGALLGSLIEFNTKGLDFVLTALFVVLFIEQIKKKENRLPGVIGILSTTLALFFFGASNLVLPAMGIVLLVLIVGRKVLCR